MTFYRLTGAAAATAILVSLMPSLPLLAQEGQPVGFLSASAEATVVPDEYIVLLRDGIEEMDVERRIENLSKKYKFVQRLSFEKTKGFAGKLNKKQVEALNNDPDVALVEQDVLVYALAQTLPTGINRVDVDLSPLAAIAGAGENVDVDIAIIDTGVEKHSDLQVFTQVSFVKSERKVTDLNGHGTHVAGIAAAMDNASGVVGVAPGARIWSVKVLNRNGSGLMSEIIKGIDYVTSKASQIDVANLSLGCKCVSSAPDTAINKAVSAGVVVVVAAGNSAQDSASFSPASNPNVITVSAIADYDGLPGSLMPATCYADVDDTFAEFSNFGATVDIAAPGVCITSTWKGNAYATISGTSMASPHVAGAAALYIKKTTKPVNAIAVAAVRTALQTLGTLQTALEGFTGDPDTSEETLLNVGTL